MAKTYTSAELEARNLKELKKITSSIQKHLKSMLTHKDSGVSFEYDHSSKTGTITLEHPELMYDIQAKNDQLDMRSIAIMSDFVKKVEMNKIYLPTFTDLYNGVMPSISITVTLV